MAGNILLLVSAVNDGRGADLLIIDDPHSESAGISPSARLASMGCTSAFIRPTSGLQPGGSIIRIMTR